MTKLKKALTVSNLLSKKRNLIQFTGAWLAAIGLPELAGTWFIYAASSNGKTTFVFQLVKYLCQLGYKVGYNSMEEGDSEAIKQVLLRVGMDTVSRNFQFYNKETLEEIDERLQRRKAPRVIVLDSWPYLRKRFQDYAEFEKRHPNTLFIIIGHEQHGKPKGTGADVHYHAHVKIRVEGFRAYFNSRYGGGEPFVIWEEGANKYQAI